jgi:ribosome-associated protein
MVEIGNGIVIPPDELVFKVSRSSGPGGQNVNKVSTKVSVLFDVPASKSLSDTQKRRILSKLASRADKHGVVRATSQKYRTQRANRRAAVERLERLLAEALQPQLLRKKTRPPKWAIEKRLEQKKQRAALKRQRAKPADDYAAD